MTTKSFGLHAKLAKIRADLNGQIVKSGEHTQGGPRYKFVEAIEVGRQFIELASAAGVVMLPESMALVDIRPSMTGKQHVYTVKVTWRITDSETGETQIVESFGQGADNSDKALPKAQTNAMKYAILMVLQAAGDDPEKDEDEPPYRAKARRTATRRKANAADAEAATAPAEDSYEEDGVDYRADESKPRRRPRRKPQEDEAGVEMASPDFKAKIRARQHEVGLDDDQFKAFAQFFTGKESSKEWTTANAERVNAMLDDDSKVELFKEVRGIADEPDSVAGGN